MTTNAGLCKVAMEVRVDDGLKNTSFEIPDYNFVFPLGFTFVAKDTTGYIRPISTFATEAAVVLYFQGITNSNQYAGTAPQKKMQVYHHGDAIVYLDEPTAVVDGTLLAPWIDPATGLISNDTFQVTVTPAEAILTVCGRCICPDYENDPCAVDGDVTDLSPAATLGALTVARVKATWNTDTCGV